MPSQTSINSPISLNLPQRPNSSNPDVVAGLVPVFAALRILQDELNKLTGGTGQTGSPGQTGLPGTPGSQIYYGVTDPHSSLGRVGDYYINTSLSSLYAKIGSLTWQWILNLGNGSTESLSEAIGESCPFYIPVGQTYTVPENKQVLAHLPCKVDGYLILDCYGVNL